MQLYSELGGRHLGFLNMLAKLPEDMDLILTILYTSQHVSSVSLSLCMKGHDCNNVRTFCSFSCKIGVQETEVFCFLPPPKKKILKKN